MNYSFLVCLALFFISVIGNVQASSERKQDTKITQILDHLNYLAQNRRSIYINSEFGDHPIVLLDSIKRNGVFLEPQGSRFNIRTPNTVELDHAIKALPKDSTYSIEFFLPLKKPLLIIQICEQCLIQKYSHLPNELKKTYLSTRGIAAIAFHEHLHAYEQRHWRMSSDSNLNLMIQEGTAFFAEAKALGLLFRGNQQKDRYTYNHLRSFHKHFIEDRQSIRFYLIPALNLLRSEHKSGSDSIAQISKDHHSINLTDDSVFHKVQAL